MKSEWHAWRERLLFQTPVPAFAQECELLRGHYRAEFPSTAAERKVEIIEILSEISIDMQSYLLRWRLQDPECRHPLPVEEIRQQAEQNYALLCAWGQDGKVESVKLAVNAINRSNWLKLSRKSDRGLINNRWGNDAATGLTEAIRKGAVLVTTNPIMVNAVRKECPIFWDRVRDEFKQAHPDISPEQRASLMTMSVVLQNCRELRPIYEISNGEFGYVSLQINPRANRDPSRMVEEVEDLHARLTRELSGTPNVLFKIPGTKAGLDTVRRLTSKGIGCTVTVNCSVDQNLAFGDIIEEGVAKISFLVVMSGRLDDLVRDQLQALGLPNAAEVAKWASIAVIRRSYDMLYRQRKHRKSVILTASLRGPWHVEGSITDGEAPIFITSFPEKAKEYDLVECDIVSHINDNLPDWIVQGLMKSQTFRQAYEVGGLTSDGFDTFSPVVATLEAFTKSYDEFLEYNRGPSGNSGLSRT
jgi:transaldolase